MRGASFALVRCTREERGASTAKARDILVIQVVVAVVFEKLRFYIRPFGIHSCDNAPAGMYWGVGV